MVAPAKQPSISQRVFLVGCPRSGTTLLQSMLMSHPRIESFPETKFFARGFGGRRRWVIHETLRGWYLWYLLIQCLVGNDYMTYEEAFSIPTSWSKTRMVEAFRDTLDRLAADSGKDIWVEKTPRHLQVVEAISDHLPDAKFIHIVRDGRAVSASMYKLAHTNPETWGQYQSLDAVVQRWNQCVHDTHQYASQDRHITVQYKRLVEAPEQELGALAAFLGVSYDPVMIEQFHREAQHVVKSHESWKEEAMSSSLQHRGLEKFRSVFSPDEQAYVESEIDWTCFRELSNEPLEPVQ
jgi:hypothetical protein